MKRTKTIFDGSIVIAALDSLRRRCAGYFANSVSYKIIKEEWRLIKRHKKANIGIFLFAAAAVFILFSLIIHGR